MIYTDLSCRSEADFKRLTGVHRSTFDQMLDAYTKTKRDFGRPSKLSLADQLLLALMYWREHRTLFHTGQAYGISESYACKIVHAVETALIHDARFHLPGKKTLPVSLAATIRMDVTEVAIQHPKKTRNDFIAAKRNNIR